MFKRVKYLIAGLSILLITGIGSGLSYWIYDITASKNLNSVAEADIIPENHNYGKPNPVDTFDIFFFPSTYYMYYQETEGKKGNNAEDLYGYINKTYDVESGQVTSEIIWNDKYKPSSKNKYWDDYWNKIEKLGANSYAVNASNIGNEMYYDLNHDYNSNENEGIIESHYSSPTIDYNKNYRREVKTNIFGTPVGYENRLVPNSYGGIDDLSTNHDKLEGREPFFLYPNRGERLGYWYDLPLEEGRILPIKYTFKGTFNPEVFSKILTLPPYSDMADYEGWHNFKFSNWVYINPGDGFLYKDMNYIFNSYADLTKISVHDPDNPTHYILRLFPTFSNGKNYSTKDDPNIALSNGWRDGFRLDYITRHQNKQGKNEYVMNSRYFGNATRNQINKNSANLLTHDTKDDFTVASIENFTITENPNNIADILIRGVKSKTKILPDGIFNNVKNNWSDPWKAFNIYGDNSDQLQNIINELTSGVYNIYIFSPIVGFETNEEAIRAFNNLDTLEEIHTRFPSLKGKKLRQVAVPGHDGLHGNGKPVECGNSIFNNNEKGNFWDYNNAWRSYSVWIEEVTEVKLMHDLPLNYDDANHRFYEVTNESLNDYYAKNFEKSVSFYSENKDLYAGSYLEATKTFTSLNNQSLIEENPYCYKLSSIDFTNGNSAFQFMASSLTTHHNVKFDLHPLKNANAQFLYESDTKLIAGQEQIAKPDSSDLFINADNYFELVPVYDKTNEQNTGNYVLRLKEDSERKIQNGYYDIIVDFKMENDIYAFNVYAYRQKNIFTKIFDEKPEINANTGMLDHEIHNGKKYEYYMSTYYIGTKVTSNDPYDKWIGIEPSNKGNNLTSESIKTPYEIIKEYVIKRELNTENKIDYKSAKHIYYLVDYTTNRIVGRCEVINPKSISPQYNITITKDFVILKNYVFYISTQEAYMRDFGNIDTRFIDKSK